MAQHATSDGLEYWHLSIHTHFTQRGWKRIRRILARQPGFLALRSYPDTDALVPTPGETRADRVATMGADFTTESEARAAGAAVNREMRYEYTWKYSRRHKRD